MPLLMSPFIAVGLTVMIYLVLHTIRQSIGLQRKSCVCIAETQPEGLIATANSALSVAASPRVSVFIGEQEACETKATGMSGNMLGLSIQKISDTLHFLSAGAVSFARGLNDTPKIVALSVAFGTLGLGLNVALVAALIALGGILSARKVTETMSQKITAIDHEQGLTANFATAFLVIFASRLGLPVSTTHVSCGSPFGIGLINKSANWKMISSILLAWIFTLPLAAGFAAISYRFLEFWSIMADGMLILVETKN